MPFQTTVQLQQASGVAGDFATNNPYSTVPAGEATLVAGASGVTVGLFAWATAAGIVSNAGSGKPTGFVGRTQGAALITAYLAESSLLIPTGFGVTLMRTGDFFAIPTVAAATLGQKCFASLTTGAMQPGNAGATIAGFIETDFVISDFPVGGTGAVGELVVISNY